MNRIDWRIACALLIVLGGCGDGPTAPAGEADVTTVTQVKTDGDPQQAQIAAVSPQIDVGVSDQEVTH